MVVYRVGDGFQNAHGQEVTEDGVLLNPEPDPENLSAQAAVEPDDEEPYKAPAKPAPPAKAKGKK